MSRKSLDDILDDNEPEVEAQAETPEPETPERPRDESGRFAKTGDGEETPEPEQAEAKEPTPEPEAVPPTAADTGLLAAKQAEKAKRQAAEDANRELQQQLEALRQEIEQAKQPPEPAPDMWADTDEWQQHFAGQTVNQAVQASAYNNKLTTSEFYARKNIEGFDEEWEPLNKWLGENPAVAQQAAADYDPWGFAFRQYRNQQTINDLGATDVASLEAKLREKIMAEMQANAPVEVPTSLSQKRSVGTRSGPAWSGPTPLGDLIGN